MNNIYVALEIGTSRTVLAIGEAETGGRLRISPPAEIPSTGVRKSQILDIAQATQSIRAVIQDAEKKQLDGGSKITIGNAFLVVSGQHVKADPYSAPVQVEGSQVGANDLDEALRASHSMPLPRDREILDIADQDYALDSRGGLTSPKGMSGRILKLNTLHVHADHNRIEDARTAAESAHLEINEPVFAATCAAEATLNDYERKNGALVLDFGGGSTGYAVYCDDSLVDTGVIGVGGDHITNDIATAFQTTNAQAEGLKTNEASATLTAESAETARVKVEQGDNTLMNNRTISRRALDTVVNARLLELLAIVRDTLEGQDLLQRLHAGVIITGGGSRLRNLDALVSQTLGMQVRIGRPVNVDGLDDVDYPPAYAAIAGALMYAHRNYEEKSLLDGLIGRFFRK